MADAGGATGIDDGAVFAREWHTIDVSLLANVIADLPTPVTLAVDSSDFAGRIVIGG